MTGETGDGAIADVKFMGDGSDVRSAGPREREVTLYDLSARVVRKPPDPLRRERAATLNEKATAIPFNQIGQSFTLRPMVS